MAVVGLALGLVCSTTTVALATETGRDKSATTTTLTSTTVASHATVLSTAPGPAAVPAPVGANTPAVSGPSGPTPWGTKLAWRAGRAPQLLWTGFRAKPGGGEVVLQTSSEVVLVTRATKDGPVFLLKDCHAIRRTDRLPLETRYFDSPITRVSLKQHAAGLEVAISLRQEVAATSRKEAGPSGSWFWIIGFAAPPEAPTTTAAATPP